MTTAPLPERAWTPGPDGVVSLKDSGIAHWHDEEWEATYPASDLEFLHDLMMDRDLYALGESYTVDTLLAGPTLYAIRIPITFDEAGDPDETEVRLFASDAEARDALARALSQSPEAGAE